MEQELLDYIKKLRQKGESWPRIKEVLSGAGWSREEVDIACASLKNMRIKMSPRKKRLIAYLGVIIVGAGFSYVPIFNYIRREQQIALAQPAAPTVPHGDAFTEEKPTQGQPDEWKRQQNDLQRIAELGTLKTALSLYLADNPHGVLCKDRHTIYASAPFIPPSGWELGSGAGSDRVDGTGWIPVNFAAISSGQPLPRLPLDPQNNPFRHRIYLFSCNPDTQTFDLNARLDSAKYSDGGQKDAASTDGGVDVGVYESGTDLTLIPQNFFK